MRGKGLLTYQALNFCCEAFASAMLCDRLERVSKFGFFLQVLSPVLMCYLDYYPNPCNSLSHRVALPFPWRESFDARYGIECL